MKLIKQLRLTHPSLFDKLIKVYSKISAIINSRFISLKGKNNNIQYSSTIVKKVRIKIKGNNNTIILGEISKLTNSLITIKGDNHLMKLGNGCFIKDSEFWFEDKNNSILLSNTIRMNGVHAAVTEISTKIVIGNDCLFSKGIDIRTGDSHAIYDNLSNERINPAKNIYIGDHVWVGKDVSILKRSTIDSGSIIGTKSLVLGKIPRNSIAVGLPAKVIKKNISWSIERLNARI